MLPHDIAAIRDIHARLREKGKGCGDCTACCTIMAVDMAPLPEPRKPERKPCGHLCKAGCAIYDAKPDSCSSFICLWLAMELTDAPMPSSWRPDRVGAVVDVNDVGTVTVHAKHENAWLRNGPLRDMIRFLAKASTPLTDRRFAIIDRPSGNHLLIDEHDRIQDLIPCGVGPTGNKIYRTPFKGER